MKKGIVLLTISILILLSSCGSDFSGLSPFAVFTAAISITDIETLEIFGDNAFHNRERVDWDQGGEAKDLRPDGVYLGDLAIYIDRDPDFIEPKNDLVLEYKQGTSKFNKSLIVSDDGHKKTFDLNTPPFHSDLNNLSAAYFDDDLWVFGTSLTSSTNSTKESALHAFGNILINSDYKNIDHYQINIEGDVFYTKAVFPYLYVLSNINSGEEIGENAHLFVYDISGIPGTSLDNMRIGKEMLGPPGITAVIWGRYLVYHEFVQDGRDKIYIADLPQFLEGKETSAFIRHHDMVFEDLTYFDLMGQYLVVSGIQDPDSHMMDVYNIDDLSLFTRYYLTNDPGSSENINVTTIDYVRIRPFGNFYNPQGILVRGLDTTIPDLRFGVMMP